MTAADAANGLSGTAGVSVAPAAASTLKATSLPKTMTAGATQSLGITMMDPYGNTASGYTGTVHFTSTDPKASLPNDYTFTSSDGGMHTFNLALKTAGTMSVSVADTLAPSLKWSQSSIKVVADVVASYRFASMPTGAVAGASFNVTVYAQDAYGNTVQGSGYAGTVHFTSTDPLASLPADYAFTPADSGHHTFTVGFKTAGTVSLTATDVSKPSITATASTKITPASASSFSVSGYAPVTASGSPHTFTVTVLDAYGNVVTNYLGTLLFMSSDSAAALPPSYAVGKAGSGIFTFTATLKTRGTQSISVTDRSNPSITGTQSGITVQ